MVLQTLFLHLKINLKINVFLRKEIGNRHIDILYAGGSLETGLQGQNVVSHGGSAGEHDGIILGGQTIHGDAFRKHGIEKQEYLRERKMAPLDSADHRDGGIRIFEFFLIYIERFLLRIRRVVLLLNRLQALKLKIKNEIYTHENTQVEYFQGAYQKELPQKKAEVKLALDALLIFLR